MPLPLAPLIPLAVRLGLVATTTFALTRLARSASHPGRLRRRPVGAADPAARLRRVIRFRGRSYEVDAGLMARFRLRATGE